MSEQQTSEREEAAQRSITSVLPEELSQVDLEAPITGSTAFDAWELGDLYAHAAGEARLAQRNVAALVYSLLQGLCQMMFRPTDRSEPFGPLIAWGDGRRSIVPSDIPESLNDALASCIPHIRNSILRARIADIAWVNNRRHGACAAVAVDAYCDVVDKLRAGQLTRHNKQADDTDYDVVGRLRRACQIAVVTNVKGAIPERVRNLVVTARHEARDRKYLHSFLRTAELDLDFGISLAADIAREAESLFNGLESIGDGYLPLALLELSSRSFRDAGDKDNSARLNASAAECCVTRADALTHAPLHEAHWLTRAIAIYGRGRATKQRRNELRKRLIDVQARTLDDFSPIGERIEIADIVEKVREAISGKPMADALRTLALASLSPEPSKLRREVLDVVKKSPLSTLFSTSMLDRQGKVTFQSPGLSGDDTAEHEEGVRFQIMQHEDLRRGLLVSSTLAPARAIINAEHEITPEKLLPLAQASPFVPPGHEFVFAQGFGRWFGGDSISAASILVPQLENSLRYLLINAGEDVTTMKNDGTQEDRSISSLFDNMREQLVQVLGDPIVFEIENVFLFRGGPALRHAVAHGQLSARGFYSATAEYGAWFIFQLCCLPLIGRWSEIEVALVA